MSRLLAALVLAAVVTAPAVAGHPLAGPVLTIDPSSLQRLTTGGRRVALIDVRPAEAYQHGRLPGAHSIPLDTLIPRRGEIPTEMIVVLYGAEGVDDAAPAFRYLRTTGHGAMFVLEGGFAGWQARGLSIER